MAATRSRCAACGHPRYSSRASAFVAAARRRSCIRTLHRGSEPRGAHRLRSLARSFRIRPAHRDALIRAEPEGPPDGRDVPDRRRPRRPVSTSAATAATGSTFCVPATAPIAHVHGAPARGCSACLGGAPAYRCRAARGDVGRSRTTGPACAWNPLTTGCRPASAGSARHHVAVSLVLIIVCANVAVLILLRSHAASEGARGPAALGSGASAPRAHAPGRNSVDLWGALGGGAAMTGSCCAASRRPSKRSSGARRRALDRHRDRHDRPGHRSALSAVPRCCSLWCR